ncbi:substrate-binding domain-containing protein [Aestuariibius insulae]|uniref:substrate-binding domain-containing protein n=1 Tax=Aestuariibius insulae TaxID=2058287 RepID=UPI00345E3801
MPSAPLIKALHGLRATFPDLPVAFSTERLGGALARVRADGTALALCPLLPDVPGDIVAHPILRTTMRAVVAPGHPLARIGPPVSRADLVPHIQLVLSEDDQAGGRDYGMIGARRWRFVDLARRLDFLLAGFGWCRMPDHLIEPLLVEGRLVPLDIEQDDPRAHELVLYAAHRADRTLGPAGRWLMETLPSND